MKYTSFANASDYGDYAHVTEAPDNFNFLLDRANEMVSSAIMVFNPNNAYHKEAAKKAACCQVLHWVETGTSPVGAGDVASYSLGDLSVSNGSAEGSSHASLCPLALQYLRDAGLTYRGLTGFRKGPQIV